MPPVTAAAVAVGVALDLLVAEFPGRVHPVAAFGRLAAPFDRDWNHPRAVGTVVAVTLPLLAAGALGGLASVAGRLWPVAGAALAGVVLFSTISLRMLLSVAREVIGLTATDPDDAREAIRALAGRDATALSPAELRSAAVESVAENLADGFVAPLLGFALGARVSLGVAVAGAVWVKAVNTLDSMLGYESKPVGWASARQDDLVMWAPARLTAGVLAVASGTPSAVVRARPWAGDPPSPNSGWPMATLAAVLDVQLRKPGVYVLHPDEGLPTVAESHRGVRIVGVAGLLAAALAGVIAWF